MNIKAGDYVCSNVCSAMNGIVTKVNSDNTMIVNGRVVTDKEVRHESGYIIDKAKRKG